MDKNDELRQKVFFIGAGVSSECGMPLLGQFLAPEFTKYVDQDLVQELIVFTQSVYPKAGCPNIENILILVDQMILRRESLGSFTWQKLQDIRGKIVYLISMILTKVYYEFLSFFSHEKADIREEVYGENSLVYSFAKTYGTLWNVVEPHDTIISFNYDLLVDTVNIDLPLDCGVKIPNLDIFYGLHKNQPRMILNNDPSGKSVLSYSSEQATRGKRVNLFKLHGSINWALCLNCKSLVITDCSFLVGKGWSINPKDNTCFLNKESKVTPLIPCCNTPDLQLCIVPPTLIKDYNNRYLEEIWWNAVACVWTAKEIIFLGYSFSETDHLIRYLFNKSCAMGGSVLPRWERITVVDVNPDTVKPAYERFFGQVEIFKGKVSTYLETISS